MAQVYRFQRSDTVPLKPEEQSQLQAGQRSQTQPDSNASGSHQQGATSRQTGWSAHSQIREQFHDFRASDNSLINLSAELLGLLVTLPQQQRPANVSEFRENLVERVSAMNNRGRLYGHPQSLMDRASYILCAALDEGINKTAWGRARGWENHSLLSRLFQQRNGGEIFFVLLDQAKQQPEPNSELLELMYVLLRLGFQGKYLKAGDYQSENHELSRMAAELYTELRRVRPAPEGLKAASASLSWQPLTQYRRTPWLVSVPALLLTGYLTTLYWLGNYNENRMLGLETLQSWKAPESPAGEMMYESTAGDMESWQP